MLSTVLDMPRPRARKPDDKEPVRLGDVTADTLKMWARKLQRLHEASDLAARIMEKHAISAIPEVDGAGVFKRCEKAIRRRVGRIFTWFEDEGYDVQSIIAELKRSDAD